MAAFAFVGLAGPALAHTDFREHPGFERSEEREPCADTAPYRRAFFGDTHVHTTFSQDASTQDTRTTPRDAYRFARGASLGIQPWNVEGKAERRVRLDRPLDFAVVTDHAEQLGEVQLCRTAGSQGYGSWVCRLYRGAPRAAFYIMNARYSMLRSRWGFCGARGEICHAAARAVWKDIRDAAEEAYDRSASCEFTSFIGYEWTANPGGPHLHRNVIFRNENVPSVPTTVMETGPEAIGLWRALERDCSAAETGCDVLTIPHNSNLSGGLAFRSMVELGAEITEEEVALRKRYDRLVEVMQHKGDSECLRSALTTDEGCGFEKTTPPRTIRGRGEAQPVDFVRDALLRGLQLRERFGVNPFEMGMIASTDTHLGTPGLTAERAFPGHGGGGKSARDAVPVGFPDDLDKNPGGLAVLWAEENSRDALFAAMQRREAYGTSGTRPTLRFFGGWYFLDTACEASEFAEVGYRDGVPMGAELPFRPQELAMEQAPAFLVAGLRDPAESAAPLERLEIVKGWIDAEGSKHEQVFRVAGGDTDGGVDPLTCEQRGSGHAQLCRVWRDPSFNAGRPAFYYARLLENPSCRWSQWTCIDAGVDCSDDATIAEGLEACCEEGFERSIQERAWSSPIWYQPAPAEAAIER